MPQIEGDAFLVAIERAKTGAVAFVFRIAPAVRVAAVGQFDFNDFAAEIAEQAAGVGPGDVAADIDANRSLECSGDHTCFKSSSSVILFIAIKKAFPPALRATGSHRSNRSKRDGSVENECEHFADRNVCAPINVHHCRNTTFCSTAETDLFAES